MLISLSWIKDFVELPPMDVHDLANDFTLRTAEVEEVKTLNQHLEKIIVVEVISTLPHPSADKLKLVTFQTGNGLKEVVCGAPNVKVGTKVPYASIGTQLPNGLILTPKEIRGVISHGMLCSADELQVENTSKEDGLLILNSSAIVGQTMAEYLKMPTDFLIDVDNKSLTHRPDLWGHLGLAREFATIYAKPLKNPFTTDWQQKLEKLIPQNASSLKLKVDSKSACKIFWGIGLSNIKVKKSPEWLSQRLSAVGAKSINSIVDISNYVLFEQGLPNHIYDQKKIEGDTLSIELAKESDTFISLGDLSYTLSQTDTIIRDQNKNLILAGIIGGTSAAVTMETTDIFLEVANWEAPMIRRTATRLGLRTDASTRFEKTLDSYSTYQALLRLIDLVLQIHPEAKIQSQIVHHGPTNNDYVAPIIETSAARINQRLGTSLETLQIQNILNSLGFTIDTSHPLWKIKVPSFRASKDISIEEDLIEEIGRSIGYDNIVPSAPLEVVRPVELMGRRQFHRTIQDFLIMQSQATEVMTYPLVGDSLLKKTSWPDVNLDLQLINALSEDADRMRPSLVPGHLHAASENAKHYSQFRIFEWGRTYQKSNGDKNFAKESENLTITFFDKNQNIFNLLLSGCENLFSHLGFSLQIKVPGSDKFATSDLLPTSWIGIHPHECLYFVVRGKTIGFINSVHPLLLKNMKLRGNLTIASFDFTELSIEFIPKVFKFNSISKNDSIKFDCCVSMPLNSSVQEGLDLILKLKNKLILESKVLDIFPKLESNSKFVTFRSYFGSNQESLTPDIISNLEKEVISALEKGNFQLKRE
ncbi:MAG: phenylalanine--tRNA ligase subunit beta [Bacteriovoracaceae bacterium]|nr:phenylalanine--tRNA ligase subunit beta [Bacteriovoracaceae bacterium]